ncbi:MAG: peptidoglycan bridge formation glycyltransferase FemA/FemB family protein [Anaerolineales bacterium]|nr:peptidoglycan bridge formation glycyltransferase FemA/FemB family protein [Anaerolineales bacterium]
MQPFISTSQDWNEIIASMPSPHLLQTWQWAEVKAKYGWKPMPFIWHSQPAIPNPALSEVEGSHSVAAAMILKRAIPVGGFAKKMCVLYVPKGPLMDWNDAALRQRVLDDLRAYARRQGAIFVKIDPDVALGTGIPGSEEEALDNGGQAVRSDLTRRGWLFSSDQIQFRNTVLIDLSPPEEELLARMKQKTRYNVRLAEKKGVSVRPGTPADLPMLYKMYAETSIRDGFVIRDEPYYQTVWQTFMRSHVGKLESLNFGTFKPVNLPTCEPLIAEVEGQAVAAIFLFFFAGRAYYLYGMSREAQREKMPNYLLQWEAMRRAKAAGCKLYDLWGAPDVFAANDPLWGVFRFKEGLGGTVFRGLGAWDYTPSPVLYKIYTQAIPRLLDILRARGKSRTRQSIGS